jgi:Tfp pilus assembly protein PilZ
MKGHGVQLLVIGSVFEVGLDATTRGLSLPVTDVIVLTDSSQRRAPSMGFSQAMGQMAICPAPAGGPRVQVQHFPRYKKRFSCQFDDGEGQQFRGIVLNVSRSGLFVRSRVAPKIGARLNLDVALFDQAPSIPLRARVVWKRKVHRSAASLEDGGIGLELETDSPEYERYLSSLEGVEIPPEKSSSTAASCSYSVRLAFAGTPRTRCMKLEASSPEEAQKIALERDAEGWEVLDVRALPTS